MTSIRFDAVSHSYGDRQVLAGINLTLTERLVGIVGANGSGKSTLARMINGLVLPTQGTVSVEGLNVARHGREVRRQVGFVFTDADTQIVMPTVAEDVAFSLRRSGLPKLEIARKTTTVLQHFGLESFADHPAHLLSGGQKQMLALAAVLVREPQIVVADEPTTLLDLRNARTISNLLTALPQQVVVVTHQLDLLAGFDRVIVIDHGRVAYDDVPDKAIAYYRSLVDEALQSDETAPTGAPRRSDEPLYRP